MIETMICIILLPIAAIASVFTLALGWALITWPFRNYRKQ